MNGQKRSEWRVIRELRDDDNFLVVGVSKRRFREYSVRVSRWVERDFAEHLMPHIHIHVRGDEVPPFDEALMSLLARAKEFIQEDVERDQKRLGRTRERSHHGRDYYDDRRFDDR